ncbi:MAG: hypothetical protein WC155_01130 [Candidatus Cloacimonadales bacterium]
MYRKSYPVINFTRKALLFGLRTVSIWIILSFLLIPIYKVTKEHLQKPQAIILTDISESMNILQGGVTKSEIVNSVKAQLESNISKNFAVEEYEFASTINGNTNNTDLVRSIEELFRTTSNQESEIFLFSDGYYSNSDFSKLKEYSIKIHTFNFPNLDQEQQPKILNVRSNRTTFLNEATPFEVAINKFEFPNLTLEARSKDKLLLKSKLSSTSTLVENKQFSLIFDKVGLHELVLSIQDEQQVYDSSKLVIKVNDDQNKIVILTDSPNWDIKYIKDAINLDKRYTYSFLTVKKQAIYENDKAVQLTNFLDECQLLILNNSVRMQLSAPDLKLLSNKIDKGLSLFLLGEVVSGLEDYYPVRKSKVDREYEGNIIPGLSANKYTTFNNYFKDYKEFPPVKYNYYNLKNSGIEIATMDNMERSPAISTFQLNKAKILHFSVQNFWRFAMRNDRDKYNDFVLNIVRWLSSKSGENFLISTNKDGYYFGESTKFNASILDEKGDFISNKKLKLEVMTSDKKTLVTDFLLWKSESYNYELSELAADAYSYKVTDVETNSIKEGSFIVFDSSLEQSHTDFNNLALQTIAEITNGVHYDSAKIEDIKENMTREKVATTFYREFKVLYNNIFLAIFILCYAVELFLRRRWGLA